jgi:GAF domain-containing protein
VIGLFVADNKFTLAPISDERIESLLTFVNTAAIVIDNARLFRDLQSSRDRLESLFKASRALVSSQHPKEVLEDIVEGGPP